MLTHDIGTVESFGGSGAEDVPFLMLYVFTGGLDYDDMIHTSDHIFSDSISTLYFLTKFLALDFSRF